MASHCDLAIDIHLNWCYAFITLQNQYYHRFFVAHFIIFCCCCCCHQFIPNFISLLFGVCVYACAIFSLYHSVDLCFFTWVLWSNGKRDDAGKNHYINSKFWMWTSTTKKKKTIASKVIHAKINPLIKMKREMIPFLLHASLLSNSTVLRSYILFAIQSVSRLCLRLKTYRFDSTAWVPLKICVPKSLFALRKQQVILFVCFSLVKENCLY